MVAKKAGKLQLWLLILLSVNLAFAVAFFVLSLARCYVDGWWGNSFAAIWITGIAAAASVQALLVVQRASLLATRARFWSWTVYSCWLAACGIIVLVAYSLVPQPCSNCQGFMGWWAMLWLGPAAAILSSTLRNRMAGAAPVLPRHASESACDAEAPKQQDMPQSACDAEAPKQQDMPMAIDAVGETGDGAAGNQHQTQLRRQRGCCRGCSCR
jgi:hypothetical protein